ncbi:MAG TPA: efflux RND transporter permease subunit [Solirubrobacteraceae bacterium]|nr:efflux RND transporter permease subunit [Solirubrobacteraceae bacterium]
MVRLERAVSRRRALVVLAWVALVAAALPFAFRQSEHLRGGGSDVPGSGSLAVDAVVSERLPREQQPLSVVLRARPGTTGAQRRRAIERIRAAVRGEASVAAAAEAFARAEEQLGRGPLATVPLRAPEGEQEALDAARALRDELDAQGPVTATLIGQPALFAALEDEAQSELRSAEAIGLPIVGVVLLIVFGSFAAALLPLVLGVVAVVVTAAEIYLLSRSLEMSVYVTNIASMLGIGVAVDYSLFVLARFREEIAGGAAPDEARSRAMATSGTAVVFSGLAVICSLATLWLIDSTLLRSMALGAILVVAAAVLVAITLLPALIGLLGRRMVRRRLAGAIDRDGDERRWSRWTRAVMRRPALSAVLATAILLALAAPALDLKTTAGPLRELPPDDLTRSATERVAAQSGGFPRAVRVAIVPRGGAKPDPSAVEALAADLRRDPELTRVATRTTSGGEVLVDGASRHDPESPQARDLVERLETGPLARTPLAQSADVHLGGEAARIRDVSDHILDSMWRVIAAALALSFVVLAVALRSILLPLKAVVMNLLSVGAAYGVLVLAFNPINNLTPPLVFVVVLGLSMDYEVFLLSRIRDRYRAHGDNRRAVAEGLATSAGTISSAALIMTAVFLTFVFAGVPSVKEIGLGTAVAIAVDATLVRLVLVPATMQLFGDWNWWLPGRGRGAPARIMRTS